MATLIQIRRDTQANWTTNNPVLALGEMAYSTDQKKLKVGDGSSAWSALDYINALPSEITAEISAAIDGVIDAAPGTLDTLNELAAAINDDASFYTTITNSISSSIDALDTDDIEEGTTNLYFTDARAQSALSGLYDPSGSASTAETNANSYTDGRETAITAAYESYADQAESDAISTASADATSKANTAESNANTYTDNLIGDGTVDGTSGNTVTDRIASAVAGLVDSAPGTLDTLNELAAALDDDPNFATSIATTISTGDSNTLASAEAYADGLAVNYDAAGSAATAESNANSYTDGEITTLQGTLESYADQAEADAISTAASDATTKANTAESNANTYTDNAVDALDTDAIEEGTTNLYFTDVRAQDATPGRVTASATMPSSPVNGDGWLDTEDGILYIYMSDVDTSQWIQV